MIDLPIKLAVATKEGKAIGVTPVSDYAYEDSLLDYTRRLAAEEIPA